MKLERLEREYYYHIYNRGINGATIFASDENKRYFLALLKKYLSDNICVFSYCLLGNHFHLVVKIDSDEKKVTQQFSNLFNAYAKAFNKMYSRTGSLFEKHFKRKKLHNEDYLRQVIIYTHLNPKHHFNLDYETYEYSSYSSYLSANDTWLERDYIIDLFDDLNNFVFVHKSRSDSLNSKYTLE